MSVPSGMATLPERVASMRDAFGVVQDYSDVIDPTTDEPAAVRNEYVANIAMMTRTCTRAIRSFLGTTGGATFIADPSSGFVHDAVWGNSAAVKPQATYITTGTLDVIWPATVTDDLGVSHTISLSRAWAEVESSDTTFRIATAKVTGARTVRVYTYSGTSITNLAGQVITVFVR